MPQVILKPKYYLDHFEELISELQKHQSHLLDEVHLSYLNDYKYLSEDARCLLIRMINRTGPLFDKRSFLYEEIIYKDEGWAELSQKSFIRNLDNNDLEEYLKWLKKEQLKDLLNRSAIHFEKSKSKDELLKLALEKQTELNGLLHEKNDLVFLERQEHLSYLLYLYFGKVQKKLILHTLRDLGIKQTNKKAQFQAKFKNKTEALNHYFYSSLELSQKESFKLFPLDIISSWPQALLVETKLIKEKLLLDLAAAYKENPILTLEILKLCEFHPASEKRARLYYQLEDKEACLSELERMMNDPLSDEELLFAEDFLLRKFQKKKVSLLTETLRNAEKLFIDEAFYRHPEFGVIDDFNKKGHKGYFAENELWTTLFWTVFLDELAASAHSEFDHASPDLLEKTFFSKNEAAIKEKIHLIKDKEQFKSFLSIHIEENLEMYLDFVDHAPPEMIFEMLCYMAQDYYHRHSGYPDIFVIENSKIVFYEVKAEGDSLKASQIKQMRQLEKVGFAVKVLQVFYQYNEDQTYVVVDLETTGALTSYGRITEIGAIKIKGSKVVDSFQTLVNPKRSIPKNIQELTGITNEMVKDAPAFEEVAQTFLDFTKDAIFVAHNVQFDYGFLQNEFRRLDKNFVKPFICTKAGMKKHYPGITSYGLKNLCEHFQINLKTHHRALCDAEAASHLLILINQRRAQLSVPSLA